MANATAAWRLSRPAVAWISRRFLRGSLAALAVAVTIELPGTPIAPLGPGELRRRGERRERHRCQRDLHDADATATRALVCACSPQGRGAVERGGPPRMGQSGPRYLPTPAGSLDRVECGGTGQTKGTIVTIFQYPRVRVRGRWWSAR
jgi:hypothetical protein